VRYLLAEEVLVIHDLEIERRGGAAGIRDVGLLYSIAERPKTAMFGKEFYPGIFSKAACYLESIATYHDFTDCNKRTSVLATSAFLGLNGYDLVAPNPELVRFVLAVATKKKSMEEIVAWLKKYSRTLK
jgi:death-on-curing protein